MKVLLPGGLPNKQDALLFINNKITVMSNNLQINPGSIKALIAFTVCLVVIIEFFK